jgi:hypothetical protein
MRHHPLMNAILPAFATKPALHAAMKLPESARRKSGRPELPRDKNTVRHDRGRPQRDAERRAGKSRKVH